MRWRPGGLVGSDEWEEFEATSVACPLLDGMRNDDFAVGEGRIVSRC
jgi:hypothetical protein